MTKSFVALINAIHGVFLFSSVAVFAQLQWETTEQEFHPTLLDKQVTAEFRFTNVGDFPVKIIDLKTVCDCTVPMLPKRIYQPGESGTVTATFIFGKRQGLQQKPIWVITDKPNRSKTALIIKTHIPKLAQIRPLAVWWKKGAKAEPKSIRFKVLHDSPIKVLKINSNTKQFVTEIKPIKEGWEYEIIVTPIDTDKRLKATLNIETDFHIESRRTFQVYAIVP